MKINGKPILALLPGAFLLMGVLCPTAQAQSVIDPTTTYTLATVLGSQAPPEAITVTTEVTELDNVYTYTYIVNNPAGDVILSGGSGPEDVGTFSLGFDTTQPGAYVANSMSGGQANLVLGNSGLTWVLAPAGGPSAVAPGFSSATLSFQSLDGPTLGNANATDNGDSPSPWASNPSGQQVPIPQLVPEPSTISLLAGFLLLLPFRSKIVKKT